MNQRTLEGASPGDVMVFGRSEGMEVISHERMSISLLASRENLEIIRHHLAPGTRWGLYPDPEWDALEAVVIVSGELLWPSSTATRVLGAGDCLIANPLREELTFEARTDVELLYICSRPVFHAYSRQCQEMMDLAVSVEAKDGYIHDHCRQMVDLAMPVARLLGLPPQRMVMLNHGAFLHDLGKVRVPDAILGKPGRLTDEEWTIMKMHTIWGREMVQDTFLQPAGQILEQHHERWDGSGYPYGLSGNDICLEAQIVGVVDSFSAMTSDRVYRAAMSRQDALADLRRNKGVLYRPDIVDAFIDIHGLNGSHSS